MRTYATLKNAPITEALIDLRVVLPPGSNFQTLEKIQARTGKTFPDVKTRNRFQAEFKLEGGHEPTTTAENQPDGLVFISKDKRKVFQAALSSFTFSWLKPYQDWEVFTEEARELWEIYADEVGPTSIIRVGTRFINRLKLPADLRDFKDYLTAIPEIPPRLPQTLISFFSRIVIPTRQEGVLAIVTQAIDRPTPDEQGILPILLDIDVFQEKPMDPNGGEIWDVLDKMRDIKNEIFFESITDKLEEDYR